MLERLFRSPFSISGATPWVLAGLLAFAAPNPAGASQKIASLDEVARESCARQVYQGLVWGAKPELCDQGLFPLPASASLKCNLYREAGYPSGLMQKACQLFDRGLIEYFIEGAEAQQ
jgi:hypothetical protein